MSVGVIKCADDLDDLFPGGHHGFAAFAAEDHLLGAGQQTYRAPAVQTQ